MDEEEDLEPEDLEQPESLRKKWEDESFHGGEVAQCIHCGKWVPKENLNCLYCGENVIYDTGLLGRLRALLKTGQMNAQTTLLFKLAGLIVLGAVIGGLVILVAP